MTATRCLTGTIIFCLTVLSASAGDSLTRRLGQREPGPPLFSVGTEFSRLINGVNLKCSFPISRNINKHFLTVWGSYYTSNFGKKSVQGYQNSRGLLLSLFYSYNFSDQRFRILLGGGPQVEMGDPSKRRMILRGVGPKAISTGAALTLGCSYVFTELPVEVGATYIPYIKIDTKDYFLSYGSVSVSYLISGFKKSQVEVGDPGRPAPFDRLISGYFGVTNVGASRTGGRFGFGIERIGIVLGNVGISTGLFLGGGKTEFSVPTSSINPLRYSILLQPFHILLGRKLRLEAGVSGGLYYSVFKGKYYAIERDGYSVSDRFVINGSIGLRYYFAKERFYLKALAGPSYAIYSEHGWSHPLKNGHGEFGVAWRFRYLRNI